MAAEANWNLAHLVSVISGFELWLRGNGLRLKPWSRYKKKEDGISPVLLNSHAGK
jgi:hypothetical protein